MKILRRRFSLRFHGWEQKRGEEEWGGEGGARLPAHYLTEGGEEGRSGRERGSGRGAERFETESKERAGGWRRGMVVTAGPHPSTTSKRERGREGEAAGPGSRRGRGGGFGPKGRKEEGGGRERIPFFIHIFQMNFFSSNIFLRKIFWFLKQSSHKRNAPACMQHKYFSKLILNFNFSKFIYFPILKMLTK